MFLAAAGRDGQRPVPGVRVGHENPGLLFRRGFIGVGGVLPAAHRKPGRVNPVVRALVAFADVIPADRRVAVGAGFARLAVGDTERERREDEARPMPASPEAIDSTITRATRAPRMMSDCRCFRRRRMDRERGEDEQGQSSDWSWASCSVWRGRGADAGYAYCGVFASLEAARSDAR